MTHFQIFRSSAPSNGERSEDQEHILPQVLFLWLSKALEFMGGGLVGRSDIPPQSSTLGSIGHECSLWIVTDCWSCILCSLLDRLGISQEFVVDLLAWLAGLFGLSGLRRVGLLGLLCCSLARSTRAEVHRRFSETGVRESA